MKTFITFNIHAIQEYLKYIYKIMVYTYTFIHIYKALNSPLHVINVTNSHIGSINDRQ